MKIIAKRGRKFYNENFNSTLVSQYILDKTLANKDRFNYIWSNK